VLTASGAQAQAALEGIWLTPEKSEMTIAACVEGFCGYISKIVITEEIRAEFGPEVDAMETYVDAMNPDEALQNRPIQGLQILTLAVQDENTFVGEIYSPKDGSTYTGELTVIDANTLNLKGCAFGVFCQEQRWTRVR
jgi:uncharacterized protein (DUF2147 family)